MPRSQLSSLGLGGFWTAQLLPSALRLESPAVVLAGLLSYA
jgi:hypothetical protein